MKIFCVINGGENYSRLLCLIPSQAEIRGTIQEDAISIGDGDYWHFKLKEPASQKIELSFDIQFDRQRNGQPGEKRSYVAFCGVGAEKIIIQRTL